MRFVSFVVAATAGMAGIALSGDGLSEDESYRLKPRFVPARVTYVEVAWDAVVHSRHSGEPRAVWERRLGQTEGWLQEVESVASDGRARLKLTFERMACYRGDDEEQEAFDSDVDDPDDADNAIAAVYAPLLGQSFFLEVDAQGHVVDCSGMDAIRERVEARAQGNDFYEWQKHDLECESKSKLAEEFLLLYPPDSARRIGDRWAEELLHRGKKSAYRMKLARWEQDGGRRFLGVTYEADYERVAPEEYQSGDVQVTRALEKGGCRGTATFDVERGELLRAVEDGHLRSESTGRSPEGEDRGTLKSEISYRQTTRLLTSDERAAERQKNMQLRVPPAKPSGDQ
ncbi:MAG TPA: DUF6263 family protein [Phycisphaerae bacterium]|nr:DUF6263 family protein [Phycisphaerae bacterium]HNU44543.1 DUF6263 family protein [Phycisphaerae bacterium]